MSPELEQPYLESMAERRGKPFKFVRQDDVIAVDIPGIGHQTIAEDNDLANPDDAGYIMSLGDLIDVYGKSETLKIGKEESVEREKTIRLIEKIAHGMELKVGR